MPNPTATAHAAVLDLLGLLTGVRDRLGRAPVRRGRPARLAVWRDILADRSADNFPRQLAHRVRAAREQLAPVRDALRAIRPGALYPSADAGLAAGTATEYVLLVAAEVLDRLDKGLPRAPTRTWLADDEVADLAGQLEPLLWALPADLVAQVGAEFAAIST
jgi:hypothetical protein